MSTPTNVRMFGWIRSATQALMISRSGNMQMRPMSPVNVMTEVLHTVLGIRRGRAV